MLRGAIVGSGNVAARGHAPGWAARSDVTIAAACDLRPERREALARFFPGIAWHDSVESLLASEHPDFVDVCTPPAAHAPVVRCALDAGAHVLCEKPLVLNTAELADLSALARGRNRALATVHNWKYAPPLVRAGEILRSGELGPVRRCRWEVHRDRPSATVGSGDAGPENWRLDPALSGGGILTDHGWHAIYVLGQWLGAPRQVRAQLTSRGEPDSVAEDTAQVEIRYPEALAEIFLTWKASERRNRVEIEGSRGKLTIDGRTLCVEAPGGAAERHEFPEALSEGSYHPGWFGGVAESFLDEIANPERRGGTLAESAVCLEAIRAARESSIEISSEILRTDFSRAATGGARR
jgi:predicted dehydrogenase